MINPVILIIEAVTLLLFLIPTVFHLDVGGQQMSTPVQEFIKAAKETPRLYFVPLIGAIRGAFQEGASRVKHFWVTSAVDIFYERNVTQVACGGSLPQASIAAETYFGGHRHSSMQWSLIIKTIH